MITMSLPYPPSINHYFSYIHGRPVLSKDAQAYRRQVRQIVVKSGAKPLFNDLAMRIDLSPPDLRRRDCDNALKAILDALQHGGVFLDDSQIVWLLTLKTEPVADGAVLVSISDLEIDEALPVARL